MELKIKNWENFQHYKDRKPPWIKLYRDILDDPEWFSLSGKDTKVLVMLWLLASEDKNFQGTLPSIKTIAFRLRTTESSVVESLKSLKGWLTSDITPVAEKWPSRYVSKKLRAEIMERDGHQCTSCPSKENLEIDHIVPVSKGGRSEFDNLQVLCRPCNRRKRVSVASATQNTKVATPKDGLLYLETETERERETKGEIKKISHYIIDYLNKKANKNFRKTDTNITLIRARLKEGYSEGDFISAIDNQVAAWKDDPEMQTYLRPTTIFGKQKFDGYVNNGGARVAKNTNDCDKCGYKVRNECPGGKDGCTSFVPVK